MVETCRKDLGALRVEDCLRDLALVTLQHGRALKVGYVVDTHGHIDTGSDQTRAYCVEIEVQDLVSVATQD